MQCHCHPVLERFAGEIGIMPCAANSLLNEEKGQIPVVCETDIHGAVTAVMAEAAGMDKARTFLHWDRTPS